MRLSRILVIFILFQHVFLFSQVNFTGSSMIDFNGFSGNGLAPNPAAGQIDGDDWSIEGMSDGTHNFGDNNTSGDFARGTISGSVTTGGLYAFSFGSNIALGVQPTGSDFTEGKLTLRLQNNTGQTLTSVDLNYDIVVYNDANRSNSFDFSYSIDNLSYTNDLTYSSDEIEDVNPVFEIIPNMTTLNFSSNIAPGGFFYLRWTSNDVSGSGSRDQIGIDNISVVLAGAGSCPLMVTIGNTSCNSGNTTYNATYNFTGGGTETYQLSTTSGGSISGNPTGATSGVITISNVPINIAADLMITSSTNLICNISLSQNENCGAAGYYVGVEALVGNGTRCAPLKTALHDLIDNHTSIPYGDVVDFMCANDIDINGNIINRYANLSGNCPNSGSLPGAFNRDHIFPSSWWGGSTSSTQYSDIHNLFPSDASTNSAKSNYPLGLVGTASYTSSNGTKIGPDSPNCMASDVFEPIAIYKGDFARAFLYMATRYEDIILGWETQNGVGNNAMNGDMFTVYETCLLNIILQWHTNDPVSQLEIDRNDDIFLVQGNRNPFVDHPEYVDMIWNTPNCDGSIQCFADNCSFTEVGVITNSSANGSWSCNANQYSINAFSCGSCDDPSEQWLISPGQNYSSATVLNFVFNATESFNGPNLEVYYSSDYNGGGTAADVQSANWNLLSGIPSTQNATIDLIAGIPAADRTGFYLAFKYIATGGSSSGVPPGSGSWTISNIEIRADDCSSSSCISNIVHNQFDNLSGLYEADFNITSQATINPQDVMYQAGECIDMQPGFEVILGAEFHAYILDCDLTTLRNEAIVK